MSLKDYPNIKWRLHLTSSPSVVYDMLATNEGRSQFWAEFAPEVDRRIEFTFPNEQRWTGKLLEQVAPYRFAVEYIDGSVATFELSDDSRGGTDLTLTAKDVAAIDRAEVMAGWVSVLLALKAAVDFGVDLRNHEVERTWDAGFVDN